MKRTYAEQIEAYYNRTLSSHKLIEFGMTPKILQKYGAPKLPLVMQQSTLTKCVRKVTGSRSAHELTRDIIEKLPEQINNPIFLIKDEDRNSIALISDAKDRNNNHILVAIRLNTTQKNIYSVNEIKSVYGKTNLREYLLKYAEKKQLHIIDLKKAERISRIVGLQLPMAEITFDRRNTISSYSEDVNSHFQKESVRDKLQHYQKQQKQNKSDQKDLSITDRDRER